MRKPHFACRAADVPENAALIVTIGRLSVGVFRLPDGFFALLNVCPHRGAPLCAGPVCGTTAPTDKRDFTYERAGELIRCAWHGWEFDIRTGRSLIDPKIRAKSYPVTVEEGDIYVHF